MSGPRSSTLHGTQAAVMADRDAIEGILDAVEPLLTSHTVLFGPPATPEVRP